LKNPYLCSKMCHESIQALKLINLLVKQGYGGFLVEKKEGIETILQIRASLKHISCSKKLKIDHPFLYKKVENFIFHFDQIYLKNYFLKRSSFRF